jgi:hypothetical protein
MDTQRAARSRRVRPPDFAARTHAARNRHPALDQKTHRQRRGVPAARDQPPEEGPFRRGWVDVKRLRVELAWPERLQLIEPPKRILHIRVERTRDALAPRESRR